MPGIPFNPAVTLDELWKDILVDLGVISPTSAGPTEMRGILKNLDTGLYSVGLASYGNGSDGALNFISSGSTTVAGATLSSGTYTMTRDIWATSAIVPAATTIVTAGFRFFCQGPLTLNGYIVSNGNSASANTAGAALSYSGTISNTTVGTAGGAGTTSTTGTAGTNVTGSLGGVGGTGGLEGGGSGTGGAGGTVTAPAATIQLPYSTPLAIIGKGLTGAGTYSLLAGGSGGGAGAGDGTNLSGGGGGGAGIVIVVAQTITGAGFIQAIGGNGGAASGTGNSGGGGGGGGGIVIVLSRSVQSVAVNAAGPLIAGIGVSVGVGSGGAGNGTGAAGNSVTAPLPGTSILIPA